MSEPLVTRDNHGTPHLRHSRLPVSAIQAYADAGYSVERIRSEYMGILSDWSDEDIAMALTYPRVGGTFYTDTSAKIMVDDDGDIAVVGWFRGKDRLGVISAIQTACDAVTAWERACDEWERQHDTD